MAGAREIPELIADFFDLAKRYVREQTLEPGKRLGRLAGFSFAGALLLVPAVIFLSVAGSRELIGVLPDGPMWSGLGYVLSALALFIITGLIMWRVTR